MPVNLQKGQKIDLTKNNPSLKRIIVGLGWDAVRGFSAHIDCDASAILCKSGILVSKNDLVCYYNLKHKSKSVILSGDNLTGAGDGDDEQISTRPGLDLQNSRNTKLGSGGRLQIFTAKSA